jgi:hypothetical protein
MVNLTLSAFERERIIGETVAATAPQRGKSYDHGFFHRRSNTTKAGEQVAVAFVQSGLVASLFSTPGQAPAFVDIVTGAPVPSSQSPVLDMYKIGRQRFEEAVQQFSAQPEDYSTVGKYPSLLARERASTAVRAPAAERPESVAAAILLASADAQLSLRTVDYQPHGLPLAFCDTRGAPLLNKNKAGFWNALDKSDFIARMGASTCDVAVVDVLRVVTPATSLRAATVAEAFRELTQRLVLEPGACAAVLLCCDCPVVPNNPGLKAATTVARYGRSGRPSALTAAAVMRKEFLCGPWSAALHQQLVGDPLLKRAYMVQLGRYLRDGLPALLCERKGPVQVWLVGFGALTEPATTAFQITAQGAARIEPEFAHWEADTSMFRALHLLLANMPPGRRVNIVANDSDTFALLLLHRDAFRGAEIAHNLAASQILPTSRFLAASVERLTGAPIRNLDAYLTLAALYILNGCDFVARNRGIGAKSLIDTFREHVAFICDVVDSSARDPLVRRTHDGLHLSASSWQKLYGCAVLDHYKARLPDGTTPTALWAQAPVADRLVCWCDEIRVLTHRFVYYKPSSAVVMVRDVPLLHKAQHSEYVLRYWDNALRPDPSPGPLAATGSWTEDGMPIFEDAAFVKRFRDLARMTGCACTAGCGSGRCGCHKAKTLCRSWCKCTACRNRGPAPAETQPIARDAGHAASAPTAGRDLAGPPALTAAGSCGTWFDVVRFFVQLLKR